MAASSTTAGALIHVNSAPPEHPLASPPTTIYRDDHSGPLAPSAYELDLLGWGDRYNGPRAAPVTPSELEQIPPSRPLNPAAEIVPSLTNPTMNKHRFASACLMFFAMGLNDSALGALLPFLESHYDISYGTVSLIFVTVAVGFISAAPVTPKLQRRLSRAQLLVLTQVIMATGYAIIVSTPSFAAVAVAFFLIGLAMALILAPNNVFITNLTNATTLLGIGHATYGVGGVVGPLVATALVNSGRVWSSFYTIPLALAILNAGIAYWANRGYETQKPSASLAAVEQSRTLASRNVIEPSNPGIVAEAPARKSSLRQTLNRTTLLGAAFVFVYQGAEVSIAGWVLSFLLAYRSGENYTPSPPHTPPSGDPLSSTSTGSIGYVTSGFWAGITLGRLLLSQPMTRWLGEVNAITTLTILSALFQLLIWLLPSLIAESIAIAVLGLFLGPIYTLATVLFSRLLDRKIQISALSVVTAMGSSGGAVAPFVTGIVSQGFGVWVLHPICLGLYAAMGLCWGSLNWGYRKRSE